MKLPFFGKKEKKEYFLSLLLRDEKVTAVIFEESMGIARVIGKHEEHVNSLETATFEEWLEVLDKTISQAESALPKEQEVQKTIFGVKENWVENEKIKKEYLLRLKKASDALGLLPIGFLVIHEAIAHLLQQEEGAPVSGVLVEIEQNNMAISLLRGGRVIETKRAKIEDNVAKTTDRLLHHFTNYEVLPSRIIVLSDNQDRESLSQVFIGHTWSKSLPFLHVPQTTILPKNFDAKAVIFGAASQMGFEIPIDSEQTKKTTKNVAEQQQQQQQQQQQEEEEEEEEDFGFLKEQDIKHKKETKKIEEEIEEIEIPDDKPIISDSLENISAVHTSSNASTEKKQLFLFSLPFVASLKYILVSFLKTGILILKNLLIRLPFPFSERKKMFFILSGLVVFLIILLLFYVLSLKANILVTVKPKVIEKNQNITFSTKNATDLSINTIAAETVSVTEEGKITKPATGKKEVGDKAKGGITIYSNLTHEQTFNKGAILTATNKLAFILDETVKVASVSGASDGQKTVKASVIAKDIGKEFNLPSGMKFTVASFNASEVEAKNDSTFSGGTKKEVTVISKNDINEAISDLTKNLEEKAKDSMNQQVQGPNKLLPLILNTKFTQKSVDKKADEEAQTLTITGAVTYTGLSYNTQDAQSFSKDLVQEEIKNDLFVQDAITYELQNNKEKNGNEITSTLYAKAFLLPKVDTKKLTEEIKGTSFEKAEKILQKLPQVSHVEIRLSPRLPFLPNLLPRLSNNIIIIIEQE